ncbi:MAG: hypothetical protein LBC41_15450 [Clostridiales bacterium]|jgi:hypothetical protein|nr:hypothetical protein [Clostridiales bacterium]MDR2752050.1 hypothetical protein [Clostridiales bacterium]
MKKKGLLILLAAVLAIINVIVNLSAVNGVTDTATTQVMQLLNGGSEEFFTAFRDFLEMESPISSVLAFLNRFPFWVMYICSVVVKVAICEALLTVKPAFFCQSGGFVLYSPLKVIANGLFGYFAFLALMIVFLVSIFGIPLAATLFLLLWVISVLGEIGLGLVVGLLLLNSLHKGTGLTACLLVGVTLIEAIRRIPYIGYTATMLLLPIVCLGIFITAVYEGWGKKNYLDLPFWAPKVASGQNVRDIIMKGVL